MASPRRVARKRSFVFIIVLLLLLLFSLWPTTGRFSISDLFLFCFVSICSQPSIFGTVATELTPKDGSCRKVTINTILFFGFLSIFFCLCFSLFACPCSILRCCFFLPRSPSFSMPSLFDRLGVVFCRFTVFFLSSFLWCWVKFSFFFAVNVPLMEPR